MLLDCLDISVRSLLLAVMLDCLDMSVTPGCVVGLSRYICKISFVGCDVGLSSMSVRPDGVVGLSRYICKISFVGCVVGLSRYVCKAWLYCWIV